MLVLLLGITLVATSARAAEPPLQSLVALVGADQGVFVQTRDGTVLASQLAERPVHPASVSKVPTSLALLARLGPTHRFETRVLATGQVRDGILAGDLVVDGGTDPYFVYENAFVVLRRLRALGIERIGGDLRMRGPFIFNWQPDPAGHRLRETLEGHDGTTGWRLVSGDGAPALRAVALSFGATHEPDEPERLLLIHRSPPLHAIIKVLNGYSNNVFHLVSDVIGGPPAVQALARERVDPAMRDEIVIDNGAGGGATNRISPRAATALLFAFEAELTKHGLTLTDALPVSGVDTGTLKERLLDVPATVVGKTGTFGSVGACALVGMLRTRRYGDVAFAVLNYWLPVPEARKRQDAFVRALIAATDAQPWPYTRVASPDFRAALIE